MVASRNASRASVIPAAVEARGMQGKATFRGHPVHLMLVPFPVAFWTGALATDVAGAATHDPFWFRMSVALIAMGSVGGIVASIFGYIDYRSVPMGARAKKIATQHLVASIVAVVLFPLAYLVRATNYPATPGVAITLVGGVVLFLTGYLGSELSNRYRVGISDAPLDAEALE